ncbi:Chemotaxis protein CheW [Gammaproteobacteria bacterium]
MATERSLVVFLLDEQRYALALDRVQRAIRVVAITPLPKAPPLLLGLIDLGGVAIPVMNARAVLNHPPRAVRLSDHLLIAKAGQQQVALLVDETLGVIDGVREDLVPADTILAKLDLIAGTAKHPEGLILIINLDRLVDFDTTAIAKGLNVIGTPPPPSPTSTETILPSR